MEFDLNGILVPDELAPLQLRRRLPRVAARKEVLFRCVQIDFFEPDRVREHEFWEVRIALTAEDGMNLSREYDDMVVNMRIHAMTPLAIRQEKLLWDQGSDGIPFEVAAVERTFPTCQSPHAGHL